MPNLFDTPFTPIPQDQLNEQVSDQLSEVEQDLLSQQPEQTKSHDPWDVWADNHAAAQAALPKPTIPPRSEWPSYTNDPERHKAMERSKYDSDDYAYESRCWMQAKNFAAEDEKIADATRYTQGVRGLRMTDEERKRRNREQMRNARNSAKNSSPEMRALHEQIELAEEEHKANEMRYAESRLKLETLRAKLRLAMVTLKLQSKN